MFTFTLVKIRRFGYFWSESVPTSLDFSNQLGSCPASGRPPENPLDVHGASKTKIVNDFIFKLWIISSLHFVSLTQVERWTPSFWLNRRRNPWLGFVPIGLNLTRNTFSCFKLVNSSFWSSKNFFQVWKKFDIVLKMQTNNENDGSSFSAKPLDQPINVERLPSKQQDWPIEGERMPKTSQLRAAINQWES